MVHVMATSALSAIPVRFNKDGALETRGSIGIKDIPGTTRWSVIDSMWITKIPRLDR